MKERGNELFEAVFRTRLLPREGAPLGKKKARLWKFYGVASNSKILAIVPGICGCKVGVRISPAQSLDSELLLSRSCCPATIAVRSSKDRYRQKTTRPRSCFSFIVCRFCDQSEIRGIAPLRCSPKRTI